MTKKITENESKTVWAKPFEGGIEYEVNNTESCLSCSVLLCFSGSSLLIAF